MTDHKITDDEVIHHLDCYENLGYRWCGYAIALINRQKAQIESLNAIHADMTESLRLAAEANKDMQAELQRLTAERDNEHRCYLHICEDLKQAVNRNITAKSEAIKEFAERLKSDLGRIPQHQFTRSQIEWSINTFVKEMTEELK